MATDTITPEAEAPEQEALPQPEATKSIAQTFAWSIWVHIGDGADECEHGEDGECAEPRHFHAFARLPNQFQHEEIRRKGLAAKARRIRALRDPESDSNTILEADLDELRRRGESARETLIDEAVGKDWWKRQLEAMNDVRERDEFEHIDTDQERLAEIEALDADKRPADEYAELQRHLTKFGDAIEARRNEIENPLRQSLEDMGLDDLIGVVREDRIAAEASRAFMETYSKWQAYVGTLRPAPRPHERVFEEIADLEAADPQVVTALREAYSSLESGLQRPPF